MKVVIHFSGKNVLEYASADKVVVLIVCLRSSKSVVNTLVREKSEWVYEEEGRAGGARRPSWRPIRPCRPASHVGVPPPVLYSGALLPRHAHAYPPRSHRFLLATQRCFPVAGHGHEPRPFLPCSPEGGVRKSISLSSEGAGGGREGGFVGGVRANGGKRRDQIKL